MENKEQPADQSEFYVRTKVGNTEYSTTKLTGADLVLLLNKLGWKDFVKSDLVKLLVTKVQFYLEPGKADIISVPGYADRHLGAFYMVEMEKALRSNLLYLETELYLPTVKPIDFKKEVIDPLVNEFLSPSEVTATFRSFANLVADLRTNQKLFFNEKNPGAKAAYLAESKRLELEVDEFLKQFKK